MSPDAAPLGLLGGTFDPLHYAHLRLAEEAREALGLAQVRLIPAGRPPHRGPPGASPAQAGQGERKRHGDQGQDVRQRDQEVHEVLAATPRRAWVFVTPGVGYQTFPQAALAGIPIDR